MTHMLQRPETSVLDGATETLSSKDWFRKSQQMRISRWYLVLSKDDSIT